MASYQSSSSVPLAPYVPTYDADLYGQVIRYKQNQYDTNVQRIQSSLDKASQLEILNPYQKQYMDNKLQETTSEVNRIAGSDFSQNSVTNQAIGIAGKIYKDPVVQTGVMSTQQIKAQMADRKRLQKAGKYNEITEFHDNEEVSRYVNSTDLSDSFRGSSRATEWFDAPKALSEAITAKNPDIEVQIGNYGQIERFTDKSKSRTPDQIKAIVNTELQNDPRIANMIGIIGKYNYRGIDDVQFARAVDAQAKSVSDGYDSLIANFEKNTTLNNTNVGTNAKVIAQLKAEKQAWTGYTDNNGQFVPGYYDYIKKDISEGNVNRAKATLQTQSFLANAIQKYTVNDHDLSLDVPDVNKIYIDQKNKDRDYFFNREKFEADQIEREFRRAFDLEKEGVKLDKNGKIIVASTNAPEEGSYTVEKHAQKTQELANQEQSAINELRKQWLKVNGNNPEFKSWDNTRKEVEFQLYKKTQDYGYANNFVNVDPNYLSWKEQYKPIITQKKYYDEVKTEVTEKAIARFPMEGNVTFEDLNLNIPLNSPVTSILKDINDKVEAAALYANAQNPGKEGDRTQQYRNVYGPSIVISEIEKYRNNPSIYNVLKQASSKGFSKWNEVVNQVNAKIGNIESARSKDIQENIKGYGQHLNDKNLVITNDARKNEILQTVTGLAPETLEAYDIKIDKKDSKTLGLDVKSVGRDNITNEFYANVVDAEGKLRKVTLPITNAERYIAVNPYNYIEEQLASRGHTSYEPSSALATSNAKLSYIIDTDYKGRYVSIIGPGGTPIRTEFRETDPSKIVQTLEYISKAVDATTKRPFTREEIINMLNNPQLSQQITINAK